MPISLKEHLKGKIKELDHRTAIKLRMTEKALQLQAKMNEDRFGAMTRELADLKAQIGLSLPRETYNVDRKDKVAVWLAVASMILTVVLKLLEN